MSSLKKLKLIEENNRELFHTTSYNGLIGILKKKKIKPRNFDNPFVSFSEIPYFGDISGNDVVLVFDYNKLENQLIKVIYNKNWYDKYPQQASYIAGEGWREQFDYDDWIDPDEYDEDGWIDPEAEEEAYEQAEINAFIDKKNEKEWITKKEMQNVELNNDDIKTILVKKEKADTIKNLINKLNTNIQIKILK